MESLAEVIKEKAFQLGFALAGITTPEPPPHVKAFEKWLSLGRHATMEYMARERAVACRKDPRLLLPECRSILVLAATYPSPDAKGSAIPSQCKGRVASYAWGRDYHSILVKKSRGLVRFLENQTGSPISHRIYTDTGPILERDLAQRAGLGWIGKNTCLINPKIGSYFFLTEILLGIDLEADAPFQSDRCGKCTRCMDACPASCILPDRTLDAGRCISYLTIENKGEIPTDLRSKMGNWIFGCDICQIVCPWNRFAGNSKPSDFDEQNGMLDADLVEEITLTREEFDSKFRNSPMRRSHLNGYLRNIAISLGNSKDTEALHYLKKLSNDPDPIIREHVQWAIEKIIE